MGFTSDDLKTMKSFKAFLISHSHEGVNVISTRLPLGTEFQAFPATMRAKEYYDSQTGEFFRGVEIAVIHAQEPEGVYFFADVLGFEDSPEFLKIQKRFSSEHDDYVFGFEVGDSFVEFVMEKNAFYGSLLYLTSGVKGFTTKPTSSFGPDVSVGKENDVIARQDS